MPDVPRYCPSDPLPPYSYVPGRQLHPVSDPRGHSFGKEPPPAEVPDPRQPRSSQPYLRGIDLFNHGYYWEAHEAWESLWKACGGRGTAASFLKGLIKLAAAGVKAKEGNADGVRRHATRAAELFGLVRKSAGPEESIYLGLSLADLRHWSSTVMAEAPRLAEAGPRAMVVFPFVLRLATFKE